MRRGSGSATLLVTRGPTALLLGAPLLSLVHLRKGCVMRTEKRTESEAIDKSLEMDIEKNVRQSRRTGVTFLQPDDSGEEMVANNLAS
jgi:hypothetical protein